MTAIDEKSYGKNGDVEARVDDANDEPIHNGMDGPGLHRDREWLLAFLIMPGC
jgi:hypothetical protein